MCEAINLRIYIYIYIYILAAIFLSIILVEKAQYNSCCFFLVKRSKNYNAVVSCQNIRICLLLFLLFDVNFFFVLFYFCETKFDVFTIFSELSGLKSNSSWKYIYQWKAQSILWQNMQFLCKKEKEKSNILTDNKRSYFPNFSLVLSANMY